EVRPAQARGGRHGSGGHTPWSSSRWTGTSSTWAVPRATCRSHGGSMGVARAVAPSLSHSRSTRVRHVPYGPPVPVPSTPAGACGCRPRSSTRRYKRRRPGRPAQRASSSISGERASKGRCRRGSAPLACAGPGTGAWRKQVHQTTPLKLTALPTDTVEVTDPTHPLYGLTFPLIGVTTKPRLGRVCVVWLYPGVERIIPLTATSLADPLPGPAASCRLSVAGLEAFLAVVAQADSRQEKVHGDPGATRNAHTTPTVAALSAGPGDSGGDTAAAPTSTPPTTGLDESVPNDPGAGPCDVLTNS